MKKNTERKISESQLSALDKYEQNIRNALERDSVDIEELQSEWQERDSPAERALRDVEWNQLHTLQGTLSEIEDARERIIAGTYGICAGCGESIPAKRMRALPTASRCIECQKEEEMEKGAGATPNTL